MVNGLALMAGRIFAAGWIVTLPDQAATERWRRSSSRSCGRAIS